MLLYVMLNIMLAYLMLFAALINAVSLYNAYLLLTFSNIFLFSCFVMGYRHIVCLYQILLCIMRCAFNLLVFLILCSHRCCFLMKGLCALQRNSTKNNNYYYYHRHTWRGALHCLEISLDLSSSKLYLV